MQIFDTTFEHFTILLLIPSYRIYHLNLFNHVINLI